MIPEDGPERGSLGGRAEKTQEEGWAAVVAATTRHFGKLDVLVNNAGV